MARRGPAIQEALGSARYGDAMRSNTGGWEEQMKNIKANVDG